MKLLGKVTNIGIFNCFIIMISNIMNINEMQIRPPSRFVWLARTLCTCLFVCPRVLYLLSVVSLLPTTAVITMWSEFNWPANQHPKSTIMKKRPTFLCVPRALLKKCLPCLIIIHYFDYIINKHVLPAWYELLALFTWYRRSTRAKDKARLFILTRNTIFTVTPEVRVTGKHWVENQREGRVV